MSLAGQMAAILSAIVGASTSEDRQTRDDVRAVEAAEPGVVGSDNRAPGPPVREEVV